MIDCMFKLVQLSSSNFTFLAQNVQFSFITFFSSIYLLENHEIAQFETIEVFEWSKILLTQFKANGLNLSKTLERGSGSGSGFLNKIGSGSGLIIEVQNSTQITQIKLFFAVFINQSDNLKYQLY